MWVRVVVCLAGAVVALAATAAPAAAHNALTSTTPADGQTLPRTPATVVLTFDQPALAMGSRVVVTGPTGPVQTGSPRLVDTTVQQDVEGGAPAGSYTVEWRVTSADGHPITGTFAFTSTGAGAGTPEPRPSGEAGGSPTAADQELAAPPGALIGAGAAVLVLLAGSAVVVVRRRRLAPSD